MTYKFISSCMSNELLCSYQTFFILGDVEKIKELLDEMKTKNIEKMFMNYSELMMAQLKW